MARYCCTRAVSEPEQLQAFTGEGGLWRYVEAESDESTFVFHRGAGGAAKGTAKAAAKPAAKKSKRADAEVEEATPATASKAPRKKK